MYHVSLNPDSRQHHTVEYFYPYETQELILSFIPDEIFPELDV